MTDIDKLVREAAETITNGIIAALEKRSIIKVGAEEREELAGYAEGMSKSIAKPIHDALTAAVGERDKRIRSMQKEINSLKQLAKNLYPGKDHGMTFKEVNDMTLRQRIADLEAKVAKKSEALKPFAETYTAWMIVGDKTIVEVFDSKGNLLSACARAAQEVEDDDGHSSIMEGQ